MKVVVLAERLDLSAAEPLLAQIAAHRDAALRLDGSAVRHLGTPCLQILLAAARDWQKRGRDFAIEPQSEAMRQAILTFGLRQEDLRADSPPPGPRPLRQVAPRRQQESP